MARHQQSCRLARDPDASSFVSDHPSPSAPLDFAAVEGTAVRHRPGAGDQRDALVQARCRQDKPRVVNHAQPAVGQQALEQLLQPRSSNGNLRTGRSRAACDRPDGSELGEQLREPVVDQLGVERGDVGPRSLGVDVPVRVSAQPRAARGSADVETQQRFIQ